MITHCIDSFDYDPRAKVFSVLYSDFQGKPIWTMTPLGEKLINSFYLWNAKTKNRVLFQFSHIAGKWRGNGRRGKPVGF
jgi:hypothetical protein